MKGRLAHFLIQIRKKLRTRILWCLICIQNILKYFKWASFENLLKNSHLEYMGCFEYKWRRNPHIIKKIYFKRFTATRCLMLSHKKYSRPTEKLFKKFFSLIKTSLHCNLLYTSSENFESNYILKDYVLNSYSHTMRTFYKWTFHV